MEVHNVPCKNFPHNITAPDFILVVTLTGRKVSTMPGLRVPVFLLPTGTEKYYQLLQNSWRGACKGLLINHVGCRVPSTAWNSMLSLALTSSWVTFHPWSKGILVLGSTTSTRNQNKCCSVFYLNLNGGAAFLHSFSISLLVW